MVRSASGDPGCDGPARQRVEGRDRLRGQDLDGAARTGTGRRREVGWEPGRPGREAETDHRATRPVSDHLGHGALGHDRSVHDDREPVGQRTRLVHGVRGQQDRPPAPASARAPGPTPAGGPPGRSRWSAHRGTAARDRPPAPARGPAAVAARPTASPDPRSRLLLETHEAEELPGRDAGAGSSRRTGSSTSAAVRYRSMPFAWSTIPIRAEHRRVVPRRVAAEDAAPRPHRGSGSPRGSRGWWSCRRHSGRGARSTSPRLDLEVDAPQGLARAI